jgi:hypothetical protein
MIILKKNGLNCFPRQLKLTLLENMIVHWGKKQLPQGTMNFSQRKAQVP